VEHRRVWRKCRRLPAGHLYDGEFHFFCSHNRRFGSPLTAFDFLGGNRDLEILVENSLPLTGGTDPFHIWPNGEPGHFAGFECFNCAPFRNFSGGSLVGVVTVPEPTTVVLLLVGGTLLALAVRRRTHA
jgi:hypothetical protein